MRNRYRGGYQNTNNQRYHHNYRNQMNEQYNQNSPVHIKTYFHPSMLQDPWSDLRKYDVKSKNESMQ